MLASLRLSLAAVLLSLGSLPAATLPYVENFNDDTVGTASPTEPSPESGTFSAGSAAFSVVSAGISGRSYNTTGTTDNTAHGSGINFTGVLGGTVASASNFTLSSQFRFNTGTSGGATAGLGFLGTSNSFATGYFIDISFATGVIRFVENSTAVPDSGASFDAGTTAIGSVFTLTLSGTYIDTNANLVNDALQLSATVSGPGLSGTINFTDTTPQIGTFFGYRHRNNVSDLNVDMDEFTVIPEPGSVALFALSSCALVALRRRSRDR